MHLDNFDVPFFRFTKYELFLPGPVFHDSCTNYAYMLAIVVRVLSMVSFPCDLFTYTLQPSYLPLIKKIPALTRAPHGG
jgi:hypothetical protein